MAVVLLFRGNRYNMTKIRRHAAAAPTVKVDISKVSKVHTVNWVGPHEEPLPESPIVTSYEGAYVFLYISSSDSAALDNGAILSVRLVSSVALKNAKLA